VEFHDFVHDAIEIRANAEKEHYGKYERIVNESPT